MKADELQLKQASNAALFSFLNLTILPVIGFVFLLALYNKTQQGTIGRYYASLGIKVNLLAATVLLFVSAVMIFFGGFSSPWTWVYVISYFVTVHALFILFATWAMVRSWSGDEIRKTHESR